MNKTKRVRLIYIIFAVTLLLSACGSKDNEASEELVLSTPCVTKLETLVTEESERELDNSNNKHKLEVSTATDEEIEESADPYVGVYNDPDFNEPNLKIEKDKDGIYLIKIGLYRLTKLNECKGVLKNNKLEFSTNELFDDELNGEITLDGKTAEVSFLGKEWLDFAGFNYQEFEKVSDVPCDFN